MPRRGYSNVAYPVYLIGTLDGTASTNTISVSTDPNGTATAPPGWPTTYPYFAVIDPDTASEEVVSVTGGTGGSLTITRGGALGASGYGTATKAHQSAAAVMHVATAADYDEANAHTNSTTAVHGLASGSAVVGTTDTQTLTGKTLAASTAVSGGGVVVGTTATQTLTNKTLDAATAVSAGGVVVGTTTTQTLTNKTLDLPTLTTPTVTGNLAVSGSITAANLTGAWVDMAAGLTHAGYTLGNGTVSAAYKVIGNKTVAFRISVTFGSTSTWTGAFSIGGLPFTVVGEPVATAAYLAAATASRFPGTASLGGTSVHRLFVPAGGVGATPTAPFTWAANDRFVITGTVEIA